MSYIVPKLKDHTLNLMAGVSFYKSANKKLELEGSGYMDDAVMWNNMNAVLDKETYTANTAYSSKTKMSFFGRADYNWKSRYYLTGTVRPTARPTSPTTTNGRSSPPGPSAGTFPTSPSSRTSAGSTTCRCA